MVEIFSDVLDVIPANGIKTFLEIVGRELPMSTYVQSMASILNIFEQESMHEFIKTSTRWKQNDPTYNVTHHWYKENVESGIYVGILRSGNKTFGLFVYACEGYENMLKRVLLNTNKIAWNEHPIIQGILPRHTQIVESVVEEKKYIPKLYVDTTVQYLDLENVSNFEISCPLDVYPARLTSNDVDYIYDQWPHNDIYTKDDIRYPVERSPSFGIFSKDNNELLAWVMQAHYGAIGMLYTKEKVRGRGYAKLLVKLIAQELTKISVQPYAMIMASNIKSITLFHSIGFRFILPMKYIMVCEK